MTGTKIHRAAPGQRGTPQDNFASIHCLGRFMISLPRGTQVQSAYISGGARVQTHTGVTPEDFENLLRNREHELASTQHHDGGPMLIERYALTDHHHVISSWWSRAGRYTQRYNSFQYFPEHAVLFRLESQGNATADARAEAKHTQALFGDAMQVRAAHDIPTLPGFCVERGLISGAQLNREEVESCIRFPDMDGVTLCLKTFVTRNPETALIERVGELPGDLGDSASGIAAVRRHPRVLGDLAGSQMILEERVETASGYEFAWEFPGNVDSLSAPFVKFGMTVEPGALSDLGPVRGLEDAIDFWDSITGSLRLRPGAV